ncbi:Beta propeller domain protein [Rubripirellula tenax]|uniref:Beta propeller domain protein n=1 Tax=Rubripirellula tenax TaxID=2528015 RepID=A0A5C6EI51_9BACT|nr:beta-propeller domain-containing protein [Rubripirellula tenax]TWU48508.1 Beta propeller domain protein [Rubripirellula tenax]
MKYRKRNRRSRRPRVEGLEQRQLLAGDLILVDDVFAADQNSGPIQFDVLGNDIVDVDYTGAGKITAVSTASLGGRLQIVADGSRLQYTPPADRAGTETFRYTVDDLLSAEVAVNIVSPLLPFETTIDLSEDEYRLELLLGSQFPDGYSGDRRITLASETALGSELRISDDGQSVVYRTESNRSSKDQFTYIVDDRFVGTAVVNVRNPLVYDQFEVIQNSGTTNLDLLQNDFRISDGGIGDGVVSEIDWLEDRLNARITHVLGVPDSVDVTIASDGRSVNVTAADDYFGFVNFRYVVDSRFEQNALVRVARPVVNDYLLADVDGGIHSLDVLANDKYNSIFGGSSIDVVAQVTSVTSGDQGGTVEVAANGLSVLYMPADGFSGVEHFDYVADGKHPASVSVEVTQPVRNDFFSVYPGTVNRIDVLANDFLADGLVAGDRPAPVITSVTETALGGTVVVGSSIQYTPPDDIVGYENDSFEYTVNDHYTATVELRITPLTEADRFEFDQRQPRDFYVLGNDHFGLDYLGDSKITSVTQPSDGGTASISESGRFIHYQPGGSFETFTYTVDDRYTETVSVGAIPRLTSDRAVADQNGAAITVDVLANDFPSYLNRTYGAYTGPRVLSAVTATEQGGTVSVNDGKIRYTPPPEYVGEDTFQYVVDDYLSQTVRVHVVRRAADDLVRVAPNSQANTLNVLANDILGADYNGVGLISEVSSSTSSGEVSIADDRRSIIYTPAVGFTGEDTFVYTIDGQSRATVTVSVHETATDRLGKFESVDQLRDYVLDLAVTRYQSQFGLPAYRYSDAIDDLYFARNLNSGIASPEFSQTNVQVAGVDEHDIVETDGFFIYTLRGNELTIVKSLPADDLELVSRTQVKGTPVGMYLDGDRVTVISQTTSDIVSNETFETSRFVVDSPVGLLYAPHPELPSSTIVTVLDVADRSAPTIVQRTEFDGRFNDSRRIDDQVFLIMQSDGLLPELELVCLEEDVCTYETEKQFSDRVIANFAMLIEEALPSYQSYDADGERVRGGPLLMPEDIYRSLDNASSMTIVASIDMASSRPGLSAVSGVMSDSSSQIFATATSLYVFTEHREEIENEVWTEIQKFNLDGQSGAIGFAATGDVPGRFLNQFAAHESDGLLRVTTEIVNVGTGNHSARNETGVFVLQDDAGVMEFVGSLQNLAVGQNVKSVRYFGDRVFVTTFETIDPLYAIDLSDATAPRVIGHVSIPGFSSYMQFITPDRLLTVGTNTATGFGGRAMVSLFDVSDLNHPTLIDQYNLPKYSTSEANNDHHAFGWFANHELLSVPTSRYFSERFDSDDDGYKDTTRFVGEDELSILHIDANGISPRGVVAHQAKVQRSVSIDDFIYSVGEDGIRAVNVGDAGTVVDEVLFDWDLVTPDSPWVPIDPLPLAESARQRLASDKGIDVGNVMLVTQEKTDGRFDIVVRTGSDHYRYQGSDENDLVLADETFTFAPNMHNRERPLDANGDGAISALDALMVINQLALQKSTSVDQVLRQVKVQVGRYVDTNGDGQVTAIDALRIINEMARASARSTPSSESMVAALPERIEVVDEVFRDEDEVGQLF